MDKNQFVLEQFLDNWTCPFFVKILKCFPHKHRKSVTYVTTVGMDAVQTTLPHRPDQPPESFLGDHLPILLQYLERVVKVICWTIVGSCSLPQDVLEMLNWTEIR